MEKPKYSPNQISVKFMFQGEKNPFSINLYIFWNNYDVF